MLFDERHSDVRFLNEKVSIKVTSAQAHYETILRTAAKSQAVSTGQLERMSWEEVVLTRSWDPGAIQSLACVFCFRPW